MSKLDGNERWKTKMLLTEHKEQYEQRHQLKITGMPSKDELTMIRDFVMYPHIIQMLNHTIDQIRSSTMELKDLLAMCLEFLMFSATDDFYSLKKELRTRNIQVYSDSTDDGILYHRYTCRGYEEKFGITREALKAEISRSMARYVDKLKHHFKNTKTE